MAVDIFGSSAKYDVSKAMKSIQAPEGGNANAVAKPETPTRATSKIDTTIKIHGGLFALLTLVMIAMFVSMMMVHIEEQRRWRQDSIQLRNELRQVDNTAIYRSQHLGQEMKLMNESTKKDSKQLREEMNQFDKAAIVRSEQLRHEINLVDESMKNDSKHLRNELRQVGNTAIHRTDQLRQDINLLNQSTKQDSIQLRSEMSQVDNTSVFRSGLLRQEMKLLNESIVKGDTGTLRAMEQLNIEITNERKRLDPLTNDIIAKIPELPSQFERINAVVNSIVWKLLGWEISGNFAWKYFRNGANYHHASGSCRSYKGRLAAAVLRDPAVVRAIISNGYIGAIGSVSNPWIGYNDLTVEGTWRWADGSSTGNELVKWSVGQPDDAGIEDCGHILLTETDRLVLNDNKCSISLYYLCEVQLN